MSFSLYGYNLNGNVEFRVLTGILVNISNGKSSRLNGTGKVLLEYLLFQGSFSFISDNDIAVHVFEKNGRRYSSSALWRAMKNLEDSFTNIGSSSFFIKRHQGRGYYIDCKFIEILIAKEV